MRSEVICLVKKLDLDSGQAVDTLKCFMLITQVLTIMTFIIESALSALKLLYMFFAYY